MLDERAGVEVDADEVERRAHEREIAVADPHPLERRIDECVGVAPAQRGLEVPEIGEPVPALRGGLILLGVAGRLARRHAERGPDHRVRARGAHRAERLALREVHGVAGAQERVEVAAPGRVDPDEISEQREDAPAR